MCGATGPDASGRWRPLRRPAAPGAALLLAALLGVGAPLAAEGTNRLAGHPSAYLALHGDDPVDWQPWGAEALARARREGKLLFVSSGYLACHWCHVMQRESFRDPEVAAFVNRHFVPVKVDRELLPALDAELIGFVRRTTGQAGWPLNVFLTPAGHPLVGTVYLPRGELLAVLRALQQRWVSEREGLARLAAEAAMGRDESPVPPPLAAGEADRLGRALVTEALRVGDDLAGGFGQQGKFPGSPQLLALLTLAPTAGSPDLGRFLRLTLDQMARLGLRDHLAGGFFRYTTDPHWRTPHFEKMLYDNALLAEVYRRAAEVLGEPAYQEVAADTLDFLLEHMADPSGGFVSSLSAVDAAGVEGGAYLWTREALAAVLEPEDLQVATLAWGLEGSGPFDGAHLPMAVLSPDEVAWRLGLPRDEVRARLESARERLRAARAQRSPPADGKLVAAWNGLALVALARAGALAGGARFREAAGRLARLLATRFWDGHELARALIAGRPEGEAALEDYAGVAAGLLAWSESSGEARAAVLASRLAEQAWRRFHGERGWRLAQAGALPFGGEEPLLPDGAMPSASALLLGVSLRLAGLGTAPHLGERAQAVLNRAYPELGQAPLSHATHLTLLQPGQGGRTVPMRDDPAPARRPGRVQRASGAVGCRLSRGASPSAVPQGRARGRGRPTGRPGGCN